MSVANRTGGAINVTMFGRNLTNNEVDVYQILITSGDPVTFSSDPLSSGNYDYQTVRGKDGSIIGQVQLDEQDPSGEISFSFYEDYDYLGSEYIYRNSKNRLLNLLDGEAFKNGEDIITLIGTNGTEKTSTAKAKFHEMNKPYKMLYYNEGGFIKERGTADPKTGAPKLRKNPFEASFNQSHETFCIEFQTTTGQGQVNRMFPIVAKSTAEWAEGDINQFNLTAQRGCDMVERNDFFTTIYPEPIPEGTDKLNEIYVNYIVAHGATEPAGAKNEILALLGDNGAVTFKKKGASTWEAESSLGGRLKAGTRIKSNKLIKTGTTVTKVNCFAVIGLDGKTLVDFTGDKKKRYFCTVKDYNKDKSIYVDYVTE